MFRGLADRALRRAFAAISGIVVASFLALHLLTATLLAEIQRPRFTGSEACKFCHLKAYEGWKKTRMANVIRDPTQHLEAVLGDFTHADPIRTFPLGEVTFVYGSRFKQSNMYHRQLRCFDCHQVHSDTVSNLPISGNALCLGCHNKENPASLKGTVEEHAYHAANSPGSQCTSCHTGKSNAWATKALVAWTSTSPWRVTQ
jgi:predicted CXXCH cytochrome family protein